MNCRAGVQNDVGKTLGKQKSDKETSNDERNLGNDKAPQAPKVCTSCWMGKRATEIGTRTNGKGKGTTKQGVIGVSQV